MQNNTPENLILLCGELITEKKFLFSKEDVDFFEFSMKVILPTGTDVLPLIIGSNNIDETVEKGAVLSVTGTLTAEEIFSETDRRLILKVFVTEVYAGETEITSGIFLTGNVIKKPYSYPFKDTERAEFEIAVGKDADAISVPVSVVGEAVALTKQLQLGDSVSILGQLHSFEYLDLNDTETVSKTAYEVEILTFIAVK